MSTPTYKDAPQTLKYAFNDGDNTLRVSMTPLPFSYDDIQLTYVAAGLDGEGEIETVTYSLSGVVKGVCTLSYNTDDKLSSVVWTI